jgi:hypothetical protein
MISDGVADSLLGNVGREDELPLADEEVQAARGWQRGEIQELRVGDLQELLREVVAIVALRHIGLLGHAGRQGRGGEEQNRDQGER